MRTCEGSPPKSCTLSPLPSTCCRKSYTQQLEHSLLEVLETLRTRNLGSEDRSFSSHTVFTILNIYLHRHFKFITVLQRGSSVTVIHGSPVIPIPSHFMVNLQENAQLQLTGTIAVCFFLTQPFSILFFCHLFYMQLWIEVYSQSTEEFDP